MQQQKEEEEEEECHTDNDEDGEPVRLPPDTYAGGEMESRSHLALLFPTMVTTQTHSCIESSHSGFTPSCLHGNVWTFVLVCLSLVEFK